MSFNIFKRKKKGYALLLTLCIIFTLMLISSAILFNAEMAYRMTLRNKETTDLMYFAQSGIEKSLLSLKQKFKNTPNIFLTDVSLSPSPFEFTDGNYKTKVTFTDITDYESQGRCVEVTSASVNTKDNSSKTLNAYILKKDISNAYFEAIFGNVINVLDDYSTSNTAYSLKFNTGSWYYWTNYTNMVMDGNMLLQGGKIDLNNLGTITKTSGEINVLSNVLEAKTSDLGFLRLMNVNTLTPITNTTVKNNVNKLSASVLPILPVIKDTGLESGMIDFYGPGSIYTNANTNYKVYGLQQLSEGKLSLVTFKIVKINNALNTTFNWSVFVRDVKDFIMRNMVTVYGHHFTGTPYGNYYGDAFENAYKGMYKLYIIDGDASIAQPSDTSAYINHIIYASGKCTVSNGGSKSLIIQNTSIMSKQMQVDYLQNGLELHGVKKLGAEAGPDNLSPFSVDNRANINQFLINHLDGYEDALIFKVYKWEEK